VAAVHEAHFTSPPTPRRLTSSEQSRPVRPPHGGQPLLRNQSARSRALDIFSHLRIWDTASNNGVLIYLLLADRDRDPGGSRYRRLRNGRGVGGYLQHYGNRVSERDFETGVINGINAVSRHLMKHFPKRGAGRSELQDTR
jgi:uncharacterized membrane protein